MAKLARRSAVGSYERKNEPLKTLSKEKRICPWYDRIGLQTSVVPFSSFHFFMFYSAYLIFFFIL